MKLTKLSDKDKSYLELANSRYRDNKKSKADKLELERDKFKHQQRKDIKNGVLGIVVGLPVFILIITFVIIGLKILCSK